MKTDKELLEMALTSIEHTLSLCQNNDLNMSYKLVVIEGRAKRMIEFIKKHQDENSGH